jgi:lipopolysaccharide/colanic/teichoic acid biosynthesis glycosyltransferase
VVGFLDEFLPLGERLLGDVRVIGRPTDLLRGDTLRMADEFILIPEALPHQRFQEITRLMAGGDGPTLRLAVSTSDLLAYGVAVRERGRVPLVTLGRARLGVLDALIKYALDVVGATLALVALTPLWLAALFRALMASRRHLFCSHRVYGAQGRPLTLWLLDPQVAGTLPVRGFPALFSVLSGRLSLVGPRPMPWIEGQPAPPVAGLTAVKPGLTGPWRLGGPGATPEDQARQDLTYVKNYSVWEDLRLLWQSVWTLWSRRHDGALGRWQRPGALDELESLYSLNAPLRTTGVIPILSSGAAGNAS